MTATLLILISTLQLVAQAPPTPALQSFVDLVEREWPGERGQQEINCRALDLMLSAINAVASERNVAHAAEVGRGLTTFREDVRGYCSGDPDDRRQPGRLRRTFINGSSLTAAVTKSATEGRPPTAHLNALERAAKSLDDDAPLRRQPDVIERFFHHGAEVLTWLHREQESSLEPISGAGERRERDNHTSALIATATIDTDPAVVLLDQVPGDR